MWQWVTNIVLKKRIEIVRPINDCKLESFYSESCPLWPQLYFSHRTNTDGKDMCPLCYASA